MQKSAWVVRYDMDTPEEIARVCGAAKTMGLDHLLVQVRGRADAMYQSTLAPRGESLAEAPPGFDPLATALTACAPVSLHAWLNVYYLWGGENPPDNHDHPGHPRHDWILGDADGRLVSDYSELDKSLGWIEGTYADPASVTYRELMRRVVAELLDNYAVAGIHLDFIRYPGPAYGQTGPLGADFQRKWGIDPRLLPTGITPETLNGWLDGSLSPAESVLTTAALFWAETRAAEVTGMVRDLREIVAARDKKLTLSAAISADAADAYLNKGQDWHTWIDQGLIDAVYPMAYFGEASRVSAQLKDVARDRDQTSPVRYWAGLGAYIKGPKQIVREAKTARAMGYNGIALFSLGHLLRQHQNLAEYVTAMAGNFPGFRWPWISSRRYHPTPPSSSQDDRRLRRILTRALGGALPRMGGMKLAGILRLRLTQLLAARDRYFKKALAQLAAGPITVPEWRRMRGIFRYAHRLDSPERWREQRRECEKARERSLNGEDFARLAEELSQGGGRKFGGGLKLRFLDPDSPEDRMVAPLETGEISPVIRVDNGFWVYLIEARGKARRTTYAKTPWPARRILFKKALAEVIRE